MKLHNRIDVHHHFIPDFYLKALVNAGVTNSGGQIFSAWTPEKSLMVMAESGSAAAILSISEPALYPIVYQNKQAARDLARKINEYLAEIHEKYPQQFGGYAVLPLPDIEGSVAELEYALDVLKLDGVALLSNYGTQFLGNSLFNSIFDALNERNGVFHVHPSVPPANLNRPEFMPIDFMQEFTFNTTRAAVNLMFSGTLERCRNLKPILAHMGGTLPYLRFRLSDCFSEISSLDLTKLPLPPAVRDAWLSIPGELSDQLRRFYFDTALAADPICFAAVDDIAPGHMLSGTDAFFALRSQGIRFAENAEHYYTDEKLLYAVVRGNAEKLFPRFKEAQDMH